MSFWASSGLLELIRARRTATAAPWPRPPSPATDGPAISLLGPGLADLAMLAFVASLVFMALEMVAGRLVQRHLGSSIYGWTSVIGVLLAGLSFGNFLGGKIADFVKNEKQASWLFLAASVSHLDRSAPGNPARMVRRNAPGRRRASSLLSQAISMLEAGLGPVHDSAELAVPDPVRRHPRVLSARPVAGNGQPRRGQAGGRPAEEFQADRHRDRPGLRVGNGRQHPRHLPDRLRADRTFWAPRA